MKSTAFGRVMGLPTNVIHLLADRSPEAKAVSDMVKGQSSMARRREIVRQDLAANERSKK